MEKLPVQVCEAGNQALSDWGWVHNAANSERDYLRIAKTALASSNLAFEGREAYTLAEVLFDSSLEPAVQGARSTCNGERQILYRAGRYQIDTQIEMGADGHTLVVTGQVVDLKQPESSGREVLVVISNLRGQVEITKTDRFGEFRREIADSGDLELFFPGLTDKLLVISLRDPLRRLTAERRPHVVRKSRLRRKIGKKT